MRAHFRQAVGHLAAEAHRTASDDGDAPGEVEDFGGGHVRRCGPGLFSFIQNSVCLYHMLEANASCHGDIASEQKADPAPACAGSG